MKVAHLKYSFSRLSLVIVVTVILVSLLSKAHAAPADLDLSFSGDGYAGTTGIISLHPDGRILGINPGVGFTNTSVSAYDSAGTLLGTGSVAAAASITHRTESVAVQSDGKIIVTGYIDNAGDETVFVARFNSDLSIDTSFASNGARTFDAGGNVNTRAYGMGIQADDKILLATRCNCAPTNSVVVRLNADGSHDTGFGVAGETAVLPAGPPFLNFDMNSRHVVISSEGKIYAAGNGQNSTFDFGMGVVRYNSDGSLDNGFGESGIAIVNVNSNSTDEANVIALQNDDKILLAGLIRDGTNNNFGVIRLGINGQPDNTFATNGIFSFDTAAAPGLGLLDAAFGVIIQPDNKIVFGGSADPSVFTNLEGVIGRLEANGTLDNSFGTNGVFIDAAICCNGSYTPAAIQADGKILAGAGSTAPASIARFEGNSIDTQPDAIGFVDQIDVAISAVIESGLVSVSGITSGISVPISISNGEYSINAGGFTSLAGQVSNGDTLQLRHTSSASGNTAVNTTIRFGGVRNPASPGVLTGAIVSDTFTSTTIAGGSMDSTPDAFNFIDQTDVALNSTITSNLVTVTGINVPVNISITGGQYSVNSTAATDTDGTVVTGDSINVNLQSSSSNSTTTEATLTIGGVSDTFSVTTEDNIGGSSGSGAIPPVLLLNLFLFLLFRSGKELPLPKQ